jgi:short-subunit dehydrogenase
MTQLPLAQRIAVVTGASSGIGAAVSLELARLDADLVLTGRKAKALGQIAKQCRGHGVHVSEVVGDLTTESTQSAILEAVHERGNELALLVHSAAVSTNCNFADLEGHVLRTVMETNFFSVADLTRMALPDLVACYGQIVVISSITGFATPPTRSAYAASKHALHGLFGSIRIEMAQHGVGVTLACPGYVATPMRENALLADGSRQGFDQADGKRMMSAEDAAAAIVQGALKRKRTLLLGSETRLARLLGFFAPSELDRLLARLTK